MSDIFSKSRFCCLNYYANYIAHNLLFSNSDYVHYTEYTVKVLYKFLQVDRR